MKKLLFASLVLLAIVGCSPNREKELRKIQQHEATLVAAENALDEQFCTRMVELYTRFSDHFPDDSLAPVFLFRAADVCVSSLANNERAVSLLDTVISLYPGFEDIAGCWFLKGLAYENAEQFDSARVAYTTFVDNFPNHPLAHDTRQSLQYLGLSPAETLEAIQSQNTAL